MKLFFINFILYFYTHYIIEDFSCIKSSYIFMYKFAWYLNSTIKWILSILIIPWYAYTLTNSYKSKLASYEVYKNVYNKMLNNER